MKYKKYQNLSKMTLVISLLPFITLIPVFLHISMGKELQTVWAGANIFCVILSLILSIICVKTKESRSVWNILSTLISGGCALNMAGCVGLAYILTLIH